MAPNDRKQLVERRMLQLLEDSGLPQPDEVQYRENSVDFLWHEPKLAVIVDLDDFTEVEAMGGYDREGIAA